MAWPGPQFHGWNVRSAAPTGWPGSWPPTAPVGYPGPPPPPPGVDSRSWLGGTWQVNPMFRGTAATVQPQTAWAPHPSWGVPAPAVPAFNPYKRIANQGDAEYFKTALLTNPLGLENMIPAEEIEKQRQAAEKAEADEHLLRTPWFWAPKELSKSDEPPPSKESKGRDPAREARASESSSLRHDSRQQHSSRQPRSASAVFGSSEMQDQQSVERHQRKSSQAQSSSHTQQQPPHRSQSQHLPTSSSKNDVTPARHRQTESLAQSSVQPSSAPAVVSSFDQYSHYLQQRQQPSRASDSRTQPAATPSAPNPPRTPTHTTTASAQAHTPRDSNDDAFSGQRQLKPTFSSNIIRTPQHYSGSSLASGSSTPTPTPGRRSTREGSKDDHASRLSRAEQPSVSSPSRQGRDRSKSRFRPSPDSSDDEPPVRPHVHGPIYGPPTPSPSHPRNNSKGTTTTSPTVSTTSRESSLASITSAMSTLTADTTPPTSAASSIFLTTFSDEPAGLLSPLMVGGPALNSKTSPRDLGRSHTYPLLSSSSQSPPSTIPAIPEERSPANLSRASSMSKTPRRSPSTQTKSPKAPRTPTSVTRSRTYPTLDPLGGEPPVIPPMPSPQNVIPPMPSPNRTVPSSRAPSPSRGAARNPLPPPPIPSSFAMSSASAAAMSQEHHRRRTQSQYEHSPSQTRSSSAVRPQHSAASPVYPSHSHSHSQHHSQSHSQSQPQIQTQPQQPASQRRVRYGYWNRRGDHLVVQPSSSSHSPSSPTSAARGQQYIVYAPRNLANPEELANYPNPVEGWMNHRGLTLRYDPSVRELPESLPSHGEPPVKPYEEFVRYVNV